MKQIYDNKDIGETIDKSFDAGIKEGYRRCMEQMMEKAVDTVVSLDAGGFPFIEFSVGKFGLKVKDKVKVIIVKEEN